MNEFTNPDTEEIISYWQKFLSAGIMDFECIQNFSVNYNLTKNNLNDEVRRMIFLSHQIRWLIDDSEGYEINLADCESGECPLLFRENVDLFIDLYDLVYHETFCKYSLYTNLAKSVASISPGDKEFAEWILNWLENEIGDWEAEIISSLTYFHLPENETLLEYARESDDWQDSYENLIISWLENPKRYELITEIFLEIYSRNIELLRPISLAFDFMAPNSTFEVLVKQEDWRIQATLSKNPAYLQMGK